MTWVLLILTSVTLLAHSVWAWFHRNTPCKACAAKEAKLAEYRNTIIDRWL